jgi:hypothetical protein
MATRPILETLRDVRHGALLNEMADELARVVGAVAESGKAGALVLKLTVRPAGKGSVRTVLLEDDLVAKLPSPNKEVTIFFPTPDGGLSRSDPDQMPLGLRVAEPPAPKFDPQTGEILARTLSA